MALTKYTLPWSSPYIIGIAGSSGSGKTTIAQRIASSINEPWAIILPLDNFYKDLSPEQHVQALKSNFDLDHPSALDFEAIYQCLKSLKMGEKTDIPVYSFTEQKRLVGAKKSIYAANIIIVEGIFSLYSEKICNLMDFKVYLDTDLDVCFSRILLRDIAERGRDIPSIVKQWNDYVKPNAIAHLQPTRANADIVIPKGSDNNLAIDFLVTHLKKQLAQRSDQHIRQLKLLGEEEKQINWRHVHILPNTNQLRAMKTIILNKHSPIDDFIFYFNRIASILISEALNHVTYITSPERITTSPGITTVRSDLVTLASDIVSVSIVHSGDCFNTSIRRIIPFAKIGKLLILTDPSTGEPQLHTEKLPHLSSHMKIFLFDSQIISGAAAIMAIKVLIDHGIEESQIILVSYTTTEIALQRICNAFPQINLVTACIGTRGGFSVDASKYDVNNDHDWWMCNRFINNRYFGTT